jgi:hypothetical protein
MRFKIKTFIQRSIRHNYKMAIKVKGRQVIIIIFKLTVCSMISQLKYVEIWNRLHVIIQLTPLY